MLISLAGAITTVVGIVGLVSHWGSTAASARIPTTTATPTTTAAPTTTAVMPAPTAQTSVTFFETFLTAIRDGNARFLAARLDSAVTQRYGKSQCARAVRHLKDASVNLQLKRFWGPVEYAYTSDGMTTQVPNTYVFRATGSEGGTGGTHEFHFAFSTDGFHLFLDCGTPLPSG